LSFISVFGKNFHFDGSFVSLASPKGQLSDGRGVQNEPTPTLCFVRRHTLEEGIKPVLSWEGKRALAFRGESFPFATILFVIDQFPFAIFHSSLSMKNEK
jgi:hypothetical protein